MADEEGLISRRPPAPSPPSASPGPPRILVYLLAVVLIAALWWLGKFSISCVDPPPRTIPPPPPSPPPPPVAIVLPPRESITKSVAVTVACEVPLPAWIEATAAEAKAAVRRFRQHVFAFAVDNAIVLAETNHGFHEMTINWVHSLMRVGVKNWIVVCLDRKAYDRFQALGVPNAFFDEHLVDIAPTMGKQALAEDAQRFRAPLYNHIVHFKHVLLQLVLEFGFEVLLSDVDIVYHQNPLPIITQTMPHCDIYAMTESNKESDWPEWERWRFPDAGYKYCLNTGLMYLRPTPATKQVMRALAARFASTTDDGLDDQAHFNQWLDALPLTSYASATSCANVAIDDGKLSFWVLHPHLFMNGVHKRHASIAPVAFHANYYADFATKRGRLQSENLWQPCLPAPTLSPTLSTTNDDDGVVVVFVMWFYEMTERRARLERDLKTAGFTDVRWFDQERSAARMLTDMSRDERYYSEDARRFSNVMHATAGCGPTTCPYPGRLAQKKVLVSIKHGLAYEAIVRENISVALILEDDAVLENPATFRHELQRYRSQVDARQAQDGQLWTALFLGGEFASLGGKFTIDLQPNVNVYRKDESRTAGAYLMTQYGARRTLDVLFPIVFGIDFQLTWVFKSNNQTAYWAWPPLVRHGSETKDYATTPLHHPT